MTPKDFFLLLVRLFLGYIFLSSGMCKLTDGQFGQLIGPPQLIKLLAKYNLELFGYYVATSQVIIGALAMSQRFSLLGLVAMVPMNASILMVTYSQQWTGTPFVNGFLLLLNLLCLLQDWKVLRLFFAARRPSEVVIPHAVRAFPATLIPLVMLGLMVVGIAFAPYSYQTARAFAALALILVFVNLFQYPAFLLPEKAILVLFGSAVMIMTFADLMPKAWGSPLWVVVAFFLVGLLLLAVAFFQRSRLRTTRF
ncbi:hypothetical protein KJS94_03375 [Flavihumibacter rivuli]|uniref:hypothetical protein n=1 Tax=Flavihumibacter rivuli TaxID=2838156 RepID=UPI001BDE56FE|nr:hypothetical protein [Flavihumibacter rivuli]ULQ57239.1 hypothetical protein KJS94_03375 [Flavihumibacter rivuli]